MKTLSIRVPEALASWLNQRAKASGRSQSEIVREALERERENRLKNKSAGEAMAELGGFFKGGPPDLSTNKKYLEGFGQ